MLCVGVNVCNVIEPEGCETSMSISGMPCGDGSRSISYLLMKCFPAFACLSLTHSLSLYACACVRAVRPSR